MIWLFYFEYDHVTDHDQVQLIINLKSISRLTNHKGTKAFVLCFPIRNRYKVILFINMGQMKSAVHLPRKADTVHLLCIHFGGLYRKWITGRSTRYRETPMIMFRIQQEKSNQYMVQTRTMPSSICSSFSWVMYAEK